MAIPRHELVDEKVSGIYHCVSRCVRKAYLLAWEESSVVLDDEDSNGADVCETTIIVDDHRRQWILNRLQELSKVFAIDCISAAVMSNHMHLLLRTLPEVVRQWSDAEVAYRWLMLHPKQDEKNLLDRPRGLKLDAALKDLLLRTPDSIAEWRKRLSSLSWYMKELKEPIARSANQEDEVTGAFWEERFKSYRVRDTLGLLACATYIDLNPVAAGMCDSPFAVPYTSIELHVRRMESNGNENIREKWKTAAAAPIVHGYEDPDDELKAFIEEFDDAEFLPALPAMRDAYGIADSWFEQDAACTISPAAYQTRVAAEAVRQKRKRGKYAQKEADEAAVSEGGLADLQPPAKAPRPDVPMITLRAYMRRLAELARLHADPPPQNGTVLQTEAGDGKDSGDGAALPYEAQCLLAVMTDQASEAMNALYGNVVACHPKDSEAYRKAAFGFRKRCERTEQMLARVARRFDALIS